MKFSVICVIVFTLLLFSFAVAVDDEMIERLVQTVERMRETQEKMQKEIHQLKGEINRCYNQTKDSQRRMLLANGDESTVKVAFDAILTHSLDHSSIEDTTIVFDSILTNVGNAYVKDFGAFIAPIPGVYLFTYTIHAGGAGDIFGTLMVNGQRKTSIHVDGSSHSILIASSSRTAILSLNQGDRVYIHILKNSRGLLSSTNNGHSAFAGALLFTNK
ncbi:C1QL [Mytilus coruscus]|uniref:C1QL n=1 Tax=Mytilus coruscus TaxID=42192 RepID=A0A6J8CCS1_MYTCO|nr:C1QL [Mytilus coruscus]